MSSVVAGGGLALSLVVFGAGASAAPASGPTADHTGGITLTVSKPVLSPGETEVFKGVLASHKRGVEIEIALKSGSQWLDIASTTTHAGGAYRITRTAPQQAGRYVFEAHDLVHAVKVTAISPSVLVTVG